MSIDIERFEEADPDSFEEPTNAERVIAFLARRDDRAWKQSEIAERTGVARGSIGPVLGRLKDRGLVRHKGEYWAITDDAARLADAVDLHRITVALDDRFGAEDRAAWVENAPPEPSTRRERE